MTKETDDNDKLLQDLSEAVDSISDKFEASEDHALLIIGAKYTEDEENPCVQTFINAAGYYGILAEALYQDLADQIENGHMALFSIIRDVIHDLEDDLGIDPDDEIDTGESEKTTLH